MATRDRFIPDNLVRLSVAVHTEHPEQSVFGKAWETVISSRAAKAFVSVFTAATIVFAIITVGNPIAHFVTTSQVGTSAPGDGKVQSMPAIQSTASAQALPPAAEEPPMGDELLAAFSAAFASKTEVDQPRADALFNQFQSWAAEKEVPAQVRSPQPILDAQAQELQKARPLPLPKRRPVRIEQTARSQIPPVQNAQWSLQRLGWHN